MNDGVLFIHLIFDSVFLMYFINEGFLFVYFI